MTCPHPKSVGALQCFKCKTKGDIMDLPEYLWPDFRHLTQVKQFRADEARRIVMDHHAVMQRRGMAA